MSRVPYAIQGVLFVPLFVALIFVLKMFCPASAGDMCFSDYFAVPVFLPLVMIYTLFDFQGEALGQELIFVLLYWGLIGFLVGFVIDILTKRDQYIPPSQYLPEQRPPL